MKGFQNSQGAGCKALTTLAVLFTFASPPCFAWGGTGHAAVCQIAWLQLSEATQQWLRPLYRAKGYDSFAESCNWADHIQSQARYDYLKPLHYVNMPRGARSYNKSLAICGQKSCITQAIEHYQQKLAKGEVGNRAEAVLLLAHLIGDIHQPMHVSYAHDWGGNKKSVRVPGEDKAQNLHWLWDVWLVRQMGIQSTPKAASKLLQNVSQRQRRQWLSDDDVHQWASESYRYTLKVYQEYSPKRSYGRAYVLRHGPFVTRRIQQAGVRLAQRLEQMRD
ncbi:S1/P1 nuclease [Halioxenophilus aromaticivorans]|uniref:S1/P1 nuclease n=1 Tax=Halioxenophilus aromaticivorans TaxID=1306992 RepID=A0AAV3TZQ7_9ALTE